MDLILKPLFNCNLRCVYCNEAANLTRTRRMTLADVGRMIENLREYYDRRGGGEPLIFDWQGGEPLLLGTEFFVEVMALQERAFGKTRPWRYDLQSNLALLDDDWIDLFRREHARLTLGISFDFFGNDRRMADGRPSRPTVLKNVRRLMKAGFRPGIICMLTRANIDRLPQIYDFIHRYPVSVRFSQLVNAPDPQQRRPGCGGVSRISNTEFTRAVKWFNRRWIEDESAAGVILNAREMMQHMLGGPSVCRFAGDCQSGFMTVLPDGAVFPCDDLYRDEYRLGNILTDPFEKILNSPVRKRWRKRKWQIHNRVCPDCDVLQYCNGGCPNRTLAYGRSLYDRDPFCSIHRGLFRQIRGILVRGGYLSAAGNGRKRAQQR